ncbi:MAG TPA: histidine decarboxylase [Jatrophihabitantaceae bacterium]|jgi:histidine decarboxylase
MLAGDLAELRRRLYPAPGLPHPIGFPAATDIDFRDLADLHNTIINNIGDPEKDGREPRNSKAIERAVVGQLTELFGGDQRDCWGYVTQAGSTEGNQFGLWLAREHFPSGVLYFSAAAHYSVPKAARILRMAGDSVTVAADDSGEMDYDDLAQAAMARADRPAIIVATVGTTMTEAVDDVARIHAALDRAGVHSRHVHVDGALSGVPLALDGGPVARLLSTSDAGLGRVDADSVCVSGHKFFATPHPNGVVLARREHAHRVSHAVDYVDGIDATWSGSRTGHNAVELWLALKIGLEGHRQRVARSRALAAYLEQRLVAAGWTAWRHPHAFTVMLESPPLAVLNRWSLATSGGWSHIICVPGLTRATIDHFLNELGTRPNAGQGREDGPEIQGLAATA